MADKDQAVPGRWHDGQVRLAPLDTPAKQAALGFGLYGVKLQTEGVAPGPIEAIIEIRDTAGRVHGRLDLDAGDAGRFMRWITEAIDRDLGSIEGAKVHELWEQSRKTVDDQ